MKLPLAFLAAGLLMSAATATGSATAWAAPATATTQDLEIQIAPGTTLTNPCNGEVVALSGFMHLITHETLAADGQQTLVANSNFQDVMGQGDLGNMYHAVNSVGVEINGSGQTQQSEITAPQQMLWVSTGSAPNFDSFVLLHGTTNADGQVTATVTVMDTSCRG